MEFLITIDTEGDNQWDHGRELTTENIRFVPRFQALCEKYSIKPTYLVTSEICENPFAKEIFSEYLLTGRAEIGAHLHSWTTPPFNDLDGYRNNDNSHAFAHELPEELLNEKVKILTDQIETSFGRRPQSFRSGRYGFNKNVAKALAENLYLVDSSVTPFVDWSEYQGLPGGSGGPDFVEYSPSPYWYNIGNKPLLELPVTILPTKFPLNTNWELARYYVRNVNNSYFLKALRKLFFNHQPLWLRPNLWMNAELFNDIIRESEKIKLPYLVMMFHSSELMPGGSIYWKDNEAVEKLYALLEGLFIALADRKIHSATLTEAAKSYRQ